MSHAFVHEGRVFGPNGPITDTEGTPLQATDADAYNAAITAQELARWAASPAVFGPAYYSFPAEALPCFGRPRVWRENFEPCLHTFVNATSAADSGRAHVATVTTWTGETLGTITAARVFGHNFGGRMVAITVRGTNGAIYHGRASWDHGQVVTLRKARR